MRRVVGHASPLDLAWITMTIIPPKKKKKKNERNFSTVNTCVELGSDVCVCR